MAIYHGTFDDASYGNPYSLFDGLEEFGSIQDAKNALRDRYESNGHMQCDVTYLEFDSVGEVKSKRVRSVYFPAVTEHARITLYHPGVYDYPAMTLEFGPRMGVKVERC